MLGKKEGMARWNIDLARQLGACSNAAVNGFACRQRLGRRSPSRPPSAFAIRPLSLSLVRPSLRRGSRPKNGKPLARTKGDSLSAARPARSARSLHPNVVKSQAHALTPSFFRGHFSQKVIKFACSSSWKGVLRREKTDSQIQLQHNYTKSTPCALTFKFQQLSRMFFYLKNTFLQ